MSDSLRAGGSGLPFPSPGDLPNPGIEPMSPELQADALTSEPSGMTTGKTLTSFDIALTIWTFVGKLTSLLFNIGEGNGTPLQYSCLENPMDGGAW